MNPHGAKPINTIPTDGDKSEAEIQELLNRINVLVDESKSPNQTGVSGTAAPVASAVTQKNVHPGNGATKSDAATQEGAFFPKSPQNFREAGTNDSQVEALVLKFLLSAGDCSGRKISEQIKLPFITLEPFLAQLKTDQLIGFIGQAAMNDYVCRLTEAGRDRARRYSSSCTYFGACPVAISDYIASIKAQSIEGQFPTKSDLRKAFSDLLISPHMLNKLGPAISSGRGMFLYGYPGNGKTSIAERVTRSFGKYIWIPRSVTVAGEIIRVYDPMNHIEAPLESEGVLCNSEVDARWVRIERPTIVVGGELMMEHLEISFNEENGISEAPVQLKSNCGVLVIDDFGRQRMTVDELLNRWIVPLEKRYDYLNLSSGQKIQVPFDQLVIFSTNLEPKDLVDDAFLRRIPYKIEVENPCREHFIKLFEIMSKVMKIPTNPASVEHLIKTHYEPTNRPFRNCHPRDLLLQVRNYCRFNELPIEVTNETFDFAAENYFSVM